MPRHDVLWQRLQSARPPELRQLGEVLRLADVGEKTPEALVEELSREVRAAAGHSLLNLCRHPHAFPYKQLLIDVADKIAPGWTFLSWTKYTLHDGHSEQEIEEDIWCDFERWLRAKAERLTGEAREQLRKETEQELRSLGYSAALVSQVGAGLTAAGAAGAVAPAQAYAVALNTASGLAWLKVWWAGSASAAAVLGAGGGVFALLYAPALAW